MITSSVMRQWMDGPVKLLGVWFGLDSQTEELEPSGRQGGSLILDLVQEAIIL